MSIAVNKDTFKSEVLESDIPVLVDFFATWCGPCRMLAPTVEEIAEEQQGNVKVCKLDIDESPELAMTYGVMSVPTLAVFKNGELIKKAVGVRPKSELEELIK